MPRALGQEGGRKPIAILDTGGHFGSINCVLFTSDGQTLISVSSDKSIRVWDTKTGESIRAVYPPRGPGAQGALFAAALSPDEKTLAVGGNTPGIHLLSTVTWQIRKTLKAHRGTLTSIAFSRDGKWLASGASDGSVRLWDLNTDKDAVVHTHDQAVTGVAFSPDSKFLAGVSVDTRGFLWSTTSRMKVAELRGHEKGITSVAWSSDSKTLVTGGQGPALRWWDIQGKLLKSFEGDQLEGEIVRDVAYHPLRDEVVYAIASFSPISNGAIALDLKTGKTVDSYFANNTQLTVAISPDGKRVASGGFLGEDSHLHTPTAHLVLASAGKSNWGAGWSRNGKEIAWATRPRGGSDMYLNDYGDLDNAFSVEKLELTSPTDDFVRGKLKEEPYSIGRSGPTRLGVQKRGKFVGTISTGKTMYRSAALVSEGRVVLGNSLGQIDLFDLDTQLLLRTLHDHTGTVWGLAPSPDGKFLLSGASDETLKVWTWNRNDPLLSFYATRDGQWIVWTPEGYYAASLGGERYISWLVDKGPEVMPAVYPTGHFRKLLHRPDLIRILLEHGDVQKALGTLDVLGRRGAVELGDILPPRVLITTPDQAQHTISESEATIRCLAIPQPGNPITALRLMVNGRPVPELVRKFDKPVTKELRESWKLKLSPGKNNVLVVVEGTCSKSLSDPVEIIVEAERGVKRIDDKNKALVEDLPALFILAIGISDYAGPLKLGYAAKDARVLASVFRSASGKLYRQVETKILLDKGATRRDILQGLTWLRKQMTQRDVAVVFFAGHGDKDADSKFYLLPADVDVDDLVSTAVPGEQVKSILASVPGRVLMFLDACHSGAVDGEKKRSRAGLTDDLVKDLVAEDYGVVVMCSAMGRETALESAVFEHGFFTLAVVESLQGKADYNKDGAIYLNEIDLYVTTRVKELSKGRQHPVTVRPASLRSFPLTMPSVAATLLVPRDSIGVAFRR